MRIEIPGYKTMDLKYLILDYNGTIAKDGIIPESVMERLKKLSGIYEIYVLTADTHGTARKICEGLPLKIQTFPGNEAAEEKRKIGGLGIFLVKEMMDEVSYEYADGKNILKLKKNL